MRLIDGWGRFPPVLTKPLAARSMGEAATATARLAGGIARGNGRAYGDAGIGSRQTLGMLGLDRFCGFDPATGHLTVEAGVLLSDIIDVLGPRGFFPIVVPGTRYVTVGGAIASDVHGKNHHGDGGFGDQVTSLRLATGAGDVLTCSRDENPDLFQATIGGMGLTGVILQATFRLRAIETGWIRQRTVVAPDLAAAIAALDAGDSATYSVAWIDCLAGGARLGRSLVYLGEHAGTGELDERASQQPFPPMKAARLAIPFDFPGFALNRLSVGAFNELYFRRGAQKAGEPFLVPASPYFFPLDGIGTWNRIYGRRGFVQHQCVLPVAGAQSVLAEMLGRIARRGDASFLAVLKKLGASKGLMSFPFPGYTLALDFAVSDGLLDFLDELDALVVAAGGRLYLAKDARQLADTFRSGYPALDRFRQIRRTHDPQGRIQSQLALRLSI